MPRIARKYLETSFFHVIVQGVNKDFIFYKNEYIEDYISLIKKYKDEFDIEILAYCIMSNHAHLLIFTEKIEILSSFMHLINSLYAQKYNRAENRVGHVFRNRYLSEPIYSEKYLVNCINYIHRNPVKAGIVKHCNEYKYSTYNDYVNCTGFANSKILNKIIGKENYRKLLKIEEDNMIFWDIDITKEQIIEQVTCRFEKQENKKLEEILKEKEIARRMINMLKYEYGITYKEMQKRFNISERKMEKLKY